ncbi:gamma-glutamylcyclotransferase family protein [Actinoplanes sp. G11-F43]|uniref:gamma-glutamylcyclotransferase family protein n=1 Tax=Actinoplanes sp. G11-F43 TaxID=3424130 RepID=UPI003D33F9AA
MALLFSYGTLRDPAVQRSVFGRELNGREDRIVGFRVEQLEITDPEVLAVSGERFHPILIHTGDARDTVAGIAFTVNDDDVARADEYEVSDYQRVEAPLRSGASAWTYTAQPPR